MTNTMMVISPYWYNGTWVFDDKERGLQAEPFVAGIPEMINRMVKSIPKARKGFRMIFSATPFPGYQVELNWLREDYGGNWYKETGYDGEGWLCPSLFKYFERAPEKIFVKAEKFVQPEDPS